MNTSEIAELVINSFFGDKAVTVGSFSRKAPFLLLKLVELTNRRWKIFSWYNQPTDRCTSELSCDDGTVVVIEHSSTCSGSLKSVTTLISRIFLAEKWSKSSKRSYTATIELTTLNGRYTYVKTRYSRSEELENAFKLNGMICMPLLRMEMSPLEKFKLLKRLARKLFTKTKSEILEYSVVQDSI